MGLCSGVAWTLRRVQGAPWLCIYMPDLGDDWRFSAPGSHAKLINSLQEHCQAAAAASRELKHLRHLVGCSGPEDLSSSILIPSLRSSPKRAILAVPVMVVALQTLVGGLACAAYIQLHCEYSRPCGTLRRFAGLLAIFRL